MTNARRLAKLLKGTPEDRDSMQELVVHVEGELSTALTGLRTEVETSISRPEDMGIVYAAGRPNVISETVNGTPKTTEIEYDAEGKPVTVTETFAGKVRTETYTYANGQVSGYTATETATI